MRYITCDHEQGTPGWFEDRLGRVSGSEVKDVFAQVKVGEAAGRAALRMKKVLERITRKPLPQGFQETASIAWGKEQEQHARMAYEMSKGIDIEESGYVYLPDIQAGCSVDGFIRDGGRVGVFEAKCPDSKTHYEYLLTNKVPTNYMRQIVHNMWVTGASFADFMSFDPRFPEKLQQLHIRVERDEVVIAEHEAAVLKFLAEVDAEEQKLRQLAA